MEVNLQDQYPNYPMYDPQTGQPFNQTNTTSLIETQEGRLLQWILNPDNIINQIENNLRGVNKERIWDNEVKDYIERTLKDQFPMMNETGIKSVMRTIKGYLPNPAFSTTNYEEETVDETSLVFGEEFTKQIVLCHDQWGLAYEDAGMLQSTVFDIIHALLLRSKNGHLMEKLTQTYSEKYIGSSGMSANAPRKRGAIAKLFGMYA